MVKECIVWAFRIIGLVFFTMIVGTVGAIETGSMEISEAIKAMAMYFAGLCVCLLIGKVDTVEELDEDEDF